MVPPRVNPRLLFALALGMGALPLWVTSALPLVDLPQHLHLISVLHRLDDPATLYPSLLEARGELTPYLGYYYLVSALGWLVPLELANRLFLTAYVVGLALGMAFLLRSLGRPTWPALLALPFAYGDSFAWGFINYCSALPLTLLCAGLFVRALEDQPARWRWAAWLSLALCAVLLFHVQAFAYLGLSLPFLLLTTPVPEDLPSAPWGTRLLARWPALAGVGPGVLLFVIWVGLRLGQPSEVAPGQPWKAWGPLLSAQNLAFKSFAQNRSELFSVLANHLRDGSDRYALYAAAAVSLGAWAVALLAGGRVARTGGWVRELRLFGLGLIALGMFFLLPFDIRGYIYYLNTRYAHLAAPLLLAAVPALTPRWQRTLLWGAFACAAVLAFVLGRGFHRFGREAEPLAQLAARAAPSPRVMGLIFDAGSRVVSHPVHLHAAADLARRKGGVPNFSFALTPHSPLRYLGPPPPTFPSEWRPHEFSWPEHGAAYDHFLLRGIPPGRVFGPLLGTQLEVAASAGDYTLVRRR
jgi:hypothetical protein